MRAPTAVLQFWWSLQHPGSGDAMDFETRKDRGPQGRKRLTRERAASSRRQEAPLGPSWRYAAMSAMSFPIASTPSMSGADAPFTPAKNTS